MSREPKPLPKFKLIPKVKIGAVDLPVYLDKDLDDHGNYASHPGQAIWICPQEESSAVRTVWHEALHAIGDLYGLPLSEERTRVLENVLLQFLMDNPKLLEQLKKHHGKKKKPTR